MMAPPIDTRVLRILRWLLEQDGARSTASLGADLGLSQRVIRYRLDAVASFLRAEGLDLERRRGSGLSVAGPPDVRERVREELSERSQAPRVYTREEREHILVGTLLRLAPYSTSLEQLAEALEVSTASARRDLRRAEEWLETRDLLLSRRPGVGVSVVGSESKLRQAMVQLLIEAVPGDVLLELCEVPFAEARLVRVKVPAGLQEFLGDLSLDRVSLLMSERIFPGALEERNSELVLSLYLAISAARLRAGHFITMEAGRHRSLADHPVSLSGASLAHAFGETFRLELPDEEVAGITEYLLGLAAVADADHLYDGAHEELLDGLMGVAGERLHTTLEADVELRRSLAHHLDRLAVRIRYGLPVYNPLLDEVVSQYPDVHAVATDLGAMIAEHFGAQITEDEVGYVTMYLCGAMERSRLRPVRKAIVVCPSGMATAWILVSRIQAEFPQLELVRVMSARAFSSLAEPDADLVITTVAIDESEVPVVVVNPLLTPDDVRRLSAHA